MKCTASHAIVHNSFPNALTRKLVNMKNQETKKHELDFFGAQMADSKHASSSYICQTALRLDLSSFAHDIIG